MSTAAQILANQQNAQHSTGPRTAEGKAASSQNNLRHGLRGTFRVLPGENQDDFAFLIDSLRDEYKPANMIEELLLEGMAENEWRTRRTQRLIDELMAAEEEDTQRITVWLRYLTHFERTFHRNRTELEKLRRERRQDQIGFERKQQAAAAQATRQQVAEARIRILTAQAAGKEIDNQIKYMIQTPLPGESIITFEGIKPFLNQAIASYKAVGAPQTPSNGGK